MALRAVVVASGILLVFALFGEQLLAALHIELNSFRIAGGIMLFLIAIDMVFEKRTERREERAQKIIDTPEIEDVSVFPMAMPMIIVGLMVGSIFGLLTAIGAEMVGGAEGLGNRLTYYSALIRMPQFFAIILILAVIGISIYIFFFWLGKKWASWEA